MVRIREIQEKQLYKYFCFTVHCELVTSTYAPDTVNGNSTDSSQTFRVY